MEEVFDELIDHIKKLKREYLENQRNIEANKNKNKKGKHSDKLLNKEKYTITVDGTTLKLTTSEFIVLKELLDAKDMFCDYETLCNKLYEYRYESSTAMSLKVLMARLRKKLGDLVKIKTVHGRGFEIVRIKNYDRE